MASRDQSPLFRKVDCPHCGNPFKNSPESSSHLDTDVRGKWFAYAYSCPSCNNYTIFLNCTPLTANGSMSQVPSSKSYLEMSYPKFALQVVPVEVPADLKGEFEEANAVLQCSPKSCAALSRRMLQAIFHHYLGIKERDLYQEIDKFIETKHPPSYISGVLHTVREFGNAAAHPRKDLATGEIIEVEPGEAEFTLDAVKAMFDFVFVQPAKAVAMKQQLNDKLIAAGKKPIP